MSKYVALAPLLLAACSQQNDNEPGVGGVTAGEARQLNEAAAKLDSGAYDPAGKKAANKR